MALERQVDFSRACFDSQCAQQSGLLAAASRDRAMPAPLFLRGGELASGTMDGRVRLLPIAAPYPLSDSSSWHEPRTSTTRQNGAASPGPIHVGEGLMEVTLQPGMSSIVDLKSRCTDGLLLLSTTASFTCSRSPARPECGFSACCSRRACRSRRCCMGEWGPRPRCMLVSCCHSSACTSVKLELNL